MKMLRREVIVKIHSIDFIFKVIVKLFTTFWHYLLDLSLSLLKTLRKGARWDETVLWKQILHCYYRSQCTQFYTYRHPTTSLST